MKVCRFGVHTFQIPSITSQSFVGVGQGQDERNPCIVLKRQAEGFEAGERDRLALGDLSSSSGEVPWGRVLLKAGRPVWMLLE